MYEASLALSVVVFAAVLAWYLRSGCASVFHPLTIYCAFHGFLFVLRPIIARIHGYEAVYSFMDFHPSDGDKTTVILAASLGFVAFAGFCLHTGNVPMRFVQDAAVREERRRFTRAFLWVAALAGPPALYSLSKIYSGSDFIYDGLQLDARTGVVINTSQVGYVTELQLMLVPLLAIPLWLSRFRPLFLVPILAFVLLRAGSGGRGPFVIALAAAGLFYLYEQRRRLPTVRILVGAALVLALFGMVGDDRGESVRTTFGLQGGPATVHEVRTTRMEGMDFANMEYFEYLVYVVPRLSGTYDYFLDNLQLFTEPVPRIYWPGKPIGEPFQRIWLTEYGRPYGMTRSLPGEGWYALGWPGVVIWCGLWGWVLGAIYRRFAAGSQTTIHTAAYLVFLPTLILGFRDGMLLTMVKQSAFYLAPIGAWFLVARLKGIPDAPTLRRALVRARSAPAPAPATATAAAPTTAWAHLPPAVRRRRMALAHQPGEAAEEA